MRILFAVAFAGLLAASAQSSVMAGSNPNGRPPEDAAMCLSPTGASEPIACTRGSSFGPSDICTCPGVATRVTAPICGKDETPPVENLAYMRARAEAARDGTLFGDSYNGQRMCVRLPKRPR